MHAGKGGTDQIAIEASVSNRGEGLVRHDTLPVPKLRIVRGLSGAGKTTWALEEAAACYLRAEDCIPKIDPREHGEGVVLESEGKMWAEDCIGVKCIAADDWFGLGDKYKFNFQNLGDAHAWCLNQTIAWLEAGYRVYVHNTFTQMWELHSYLVAASNMGLTTEVVSFFDSGCTNEELANRGAHGVPIGEIQKQRERWEMDWRQGNPVKPWDREPTDLVDNVAAGSSVEAKTEGLLTDSRVISSNGVHE